jgi:hypothetical protein
LKQLVHANEITNFAQQKFKSITMVFDLDLIRKTYQGMPARVDAARKALGRPLTLAEKILFSHLWTGVEPRDFERGQAYVILPVVKWWPFPLLSIVTT